MLCLIGYAVFLALGSQYEVSFVVRAILYALSGACLAMLSVFIGRSYARPGKRLSRQFVWSWVGMAGFGVLMTTSPGFETPVRIVLAAGGTACLLLPLFYIWKIWKVKPTDAI
jgi:hypothetical protein